jgi:hypothetical protein
MAMSSDYGRERVHRAEVNRAMAPIGSYGPDYSPVLDLAKYEYPESDDECGHRMIVNAFALAFTSLFILASVWFGPVVGANCDRARHPRRDRRKSPTTSCASFSVLRVMAQHPCLSFRPGKPGFARRARAGIQ